VGATGRGLVYQSVASECAPHPWSTETTRASSGEIAFAHTPNDERSEPAIGKKNAHEEHGFGAACAIGDCGPRSLSYQRLLA
jgi:hypothetical protein